jgi:hypothetical protein
LKRPFLIRSGESGWNSRYFGRSPGKLGLGHIPDYQVHLFRVKKLKPTSVAVRLAAIRFLQVAVLKTPLDGH